MVIITIIAIEVLKIEKQKIIIYLALKILLLYAEWMEGSEFSIMKALK